MNPGVSFRHVRSTRMGGGGLLGLLVFGIVTLVGVLLTSIVLSLLLAPFRLFLSRVRRRDPNLERPPVTVHRGGEGEPQAIPPAWEPSDAIEARYEEVS